MAIEAQKRAREKYNKETYKFTTFKLNKTTEADLIKHLEAQPNKQGYLRELIREDYLKSSLQPFTKIKLTAQFIGETGMGFIGGKVYQIRTECKEIMLDSRPTPCLCIYDLHSDAWCPYSNLETILQNWKIINK